MHDEPIMDVAHLGHLELLTPKPEESLRFFVDVMGMTESGRRATASICAPGTITSATRSSSRRRHVGHRPCRPSAREPAGARSGG